MRERLDGYVQSVAASWYGVVANPMTGAQDFGENPRCIAGGLPGSPTKAIVQHAVALLVEADARLAYFEEHGSWPSDDDGPELEFLIASTG